MMELYQAFADWTDVMDDHRGARSPRPRVDALGTTASCTIRGETVDLAEPWPRVRMVDARVEPRSGATVHPSQPVDELRALAEQHGVRVRAVAGAAGKIIEELFEELCEADLVAPDVRHRPPGRDLAARPRRPQRPVRSPSGSSCSSTPASWPTATPSSTIRSSSALRFEEEQAAKDAGDAEARHGRRGLPAGARVRHAADRRARHRHGPGGDAARRRRHRSRRSSCSPPFDPEVSDIDDANDAHGAPACATVAADGIDARHAGTAGSAGASSATTTARPIPSSTRSSACATPPTTCAA